ncbi:putative methyltransferase [Desulfamplus magnetovallimortis]|uniref:Putative methyltransferase n=1 Tax=Desulfamplus magnetovallimortis TaxID=1246637 RepID=A0A1W1HFS7_9BACT|nr:class I SAM-dependent methyltransferase [Desulfamplus magnetovallimortis]SLM31371.1 putative methyltransferase [Desulfamplus magnetovallimortis]
MKTLSRSDLVDLSLEITWEKNGIHHSDRYFADQLNCWRDVFPGSPFEKLFDHDIEHPVTFQANPGDLVPDHSNDKILRLPLSRVNSDRLKHSIDVGRFYPQGIISGLTGVFRDTITPFRCIGLSQSIITADLNHPMAGIPFQLTMEVNKHSSKANERGGSCMDWIDIALSGPGMQARSNAKATDFFSQHAFHRKDPRPDADFYKKDRFVHHIDDQARENLAAIYQSLVRPGDSILDLMAGWESHIPETLEPLSLHGIGLNANELANNPALTSYTVQDLNINPELAFKDNIFDHAICSLSVEYLTDPIRIFQEIARVLKPGGAFIVSFSNRWFPEKSIRIWEDLHDFERMGLVTEYFLLSDRYESISTLSLRGYPRPYDDDYFPKLRLSDPIYTVIGHTRHYLQRYYR